MQIISDHIRKVFWLGTAVVGEVFRFRTRKDFLPDRGEGGDGVLRAGLPGDPGADGMPVALKVISKTDIQTKNCRAKIEKEIEVLKMVNNNRFVIKLMEVFEDEAAVQLRLRVPQKRRPDRVLPEKP
jgi:serine/threonine protein kinase